MICTKVINGEKTSIYLVMLRFFCWNWTFFCLLPEQIVWPSMLTTLALNTTWKVIFLSVFFVCARASEVHRTICCQQTQRAIQSEEREKLRDKRQSSLCVSQCVSSSSIMDRMGSSANREKAARTDHRILKNRLSWQEIMEWPLTVLIYETVSHISVCFFLFTLPWCLFSLSPFVIKSISATVAFFCVQMQCALLGDLNASINLNLIAGERARAGIFH